MADRIDIAAIRARLAATANGYTRETSGTARALCDEVERLRSLVDFHQHKAEEWEESAEIERARAEAAVAERDEARAEVERLCEIIAGRTTPPTDAEIDAHEKAGGWWQWASADTFEHVMGEEIPDLIPCTNVERWWALDASGAPCAWPVVTKEVE